MNADPPPPGNKPGDHVSLGGCVLAYEIEQVKFSLPDNIRRLLERLSGTLSVRQVDRKNKAEELEAMRQGMELLAQGHIITEPLVTVYDLDDIEQAPAALGREHRAAHATAVPRRARHAGGCL